MVAKTLVQAILPSLVAAAALQTRGDSSFDYDSLSLRTVGARNTLVSGTALFYPSCSPC